MSSYGRYMVFDVSIISFYKKSSSNYFISLSICVLKLPKSNWTSIYIASSALFKLSKFVRPID